MVTTADTDRVFWCQNLYIAHFSLMVTFSNTAVFSHIFRSVLIRFADRGLVLQGRPNLKLFNQLFWLILIPFCCIGLLMAPFYSILKGVFAQQFVAKICILAPGLKIDSHQDPRQMIKQTIVPLIVPSLFLAYCQYLTYQVRQYFRGTCPNQKMHSFGNYRRNFITFEENIDYLQIHFFYTFVTNILNVLFFNGEKFSLTPQQMSLTLNLWNFFFFDIFYGIFVPTKFLIIKRNVNVAKPFWQKESIPEPRRSGPTSNLSLNPVLRHVRPFRQEQTGERGGAETSFSVEEVKVKYSSVEEGGSSSKTDENNRGSAIRSDSGASSTNTDLATRTNTKANTNTKTSTYTSLATSLHLVTVEIH